MLCLRRMVALCGIGIVALGFFGFFAERGDALAKKKGIPPIQPPVSTGSASGMSSVKITEDSKFRRFINVGRDCIKDKDWNQAIEALQTVLEEKKDAYVQVYETDAFGKETQRWTSVKFEANNLIGSMEKEGLDAYENKHGGDARTKLDEAKAKGDRERIAEVAQQFCHTKAGIEANEILATLYLARGQVFTAALRFEKLLQLNPDQAKLSDLTLYKASIAFHRAGDKKNKDATWERLLKNLQGKRSLKIGTEEVALAKLESVFAETGSETSLVSVADWPSWRGNVRNSAQASGSPPLLDTKLWSRPLYLDVLDGFNDQDPDQPAKDRVQKTIDQANNANLPVMSGSFPIASQGIMVYRSPRDIRAVALKTIQVKDEESGTVTEIKPGQIVWKSIPMNRSLSLLLEKNNTRVKVEQWFTGVGNVQGFDAVPGLGNFLYENSLIGTMVTDHRFVYAINDLAVPPHPAAFMQNQFNPQMNQFNPGDVKPLIMQNEMYAYDLITGKLKWDLNHDDPEFRDSHFISLPISVGGKLYVLNERLKDPNQNVGGPGIGGNTNLIGGESELRLICIDPNKLRTVNSNVKPTIVSDQVLGDVIQYNRYVQDVGRRVNAVQLAYDEGVLVCPTNAGEVFGIDLMTRSLVWSYPYRENVHQSLFLPGMQFMPQPGKANQGGTTVHSKWKSSPPAVQDGKIVFTAPDSDSVHCISLRDGKPIWRKGQQKGDLFMAGVYAGRVVIVSETNIRGIDLKTGQQLWSLPTGDLPSGQGVASKNIYYLPLKKGEILAIDVVKGEIKAHNRAAAGVTPGNLVFYDTMVLSQTPMEVAAYPQLTARLDLAKVDSAKDPENLTKLTDYGELLLKDGQVDAAVTALLKAYNQNPTDPLAKRVRERLFEALTDLMQIDFNKADKDHLTVYKALCTVPGNPGEEQNRKAKFFRLVGQGREAQGNLVEAFQMYKDFGALPIHQGQGGIPSTEDPNYKIPVSVWLRGRISGMLMKATKEQKAPLEAQIAKDWKDVEAKKDPDAIRSFVAMFDIPVPVGREARVRLAETIMERNERGNFLEAEMLLNQVMGSEYRSEPQTGGRALAALAQLEEKKGTPDSMRLAAAYYRELARDYADKAVRGSKTGADLLSALATDKRYLPYLESASNPFGPVKIASRDLGPGQANVGLPGFVLVPQGAETPFAQQNRLMLDPSDTINPRIRLRDTVTNQDRWTTNLGRVEMNQQLYFHLYQQQNINQPQNVNARYRFYKVKGHLMVCQVGVMVYCLDGDTGKKLWEVQVAENIPQNGFNFLQQVIPDHEGNPVFHFRNQQTNQVNPVALGRIGAVQASYVALLGNKGLSVHDPLRGTVMWKKADYSVNSHVFGDEQYLFIADWNGAAFAVGKTYRASDGEILPIPDFSAVYQTRIRTMGRHILAKSGAGANLTVHLYDIVTGKDVWSKQFPAGSYVANTEDANIAGVVEPNGKLTVLDSATGNVLVSSNLVQFRITAEDFKGLSDVVLLQDSDRFYLALNKRVSATRVVGGLVHNNFNNGTRCVHVNGWFLAVQRHDGKKQVGDKVLAYKKGDLAWHSYMPVSNQMIILDQFEQSPIALFTARYVEILPNGGNRWVSVTQSYHKAKGTMIHDSGPQPINGQPMFSAFQMDLKARTINLIGFSGSVQHYVDDGKGPPQGGATLNPPGFQPGVGLVQPGGVGQPGFGGPGFMPPGGRPLPPNVRIMRGLANPPIQILPVQPPVVEIEIVPPIEVPEIRKR